MRLHSGQEMSDQMVLRSPVRPLLRGSWWLWCCGWRWAWGSHAPDRGGRAGLPPAPSSSTPAEDEASAKWSGWASGAPRSLWNLTGFLVLRFSTESPQTPAPWIFRYLSAYDPVSEESPPIASPGYLVIKDKLYIHHFNSNTWHNVFLQVFEWKTLT